MVITKEAIKAFFSNKKVQAGAFIGFLATLIITGLSIGNQAGIPTNQITGAAIGIPTPTPDDNSFEEAIRIIGSTKAENQTPLYNKQCIVDIQQSEETIDQSYQNKIDAFNKLKELEDTLDKARDDYKKALDEYYTASQNLEKLHQDLDRVKESCP